MDFEKNKHDAVEVQKPPAESREKESFREKINRLVGNIGAKLVEFSQQRKSYESSMENTNPQASFTQEEQEKLSAIESSAQAEAEKTSASLQEFESDEPTELARAQDSVVEQPVEVVTDIKAEELLKEEKAAEQTPEQPKTPEERLEGLKQKAGVLAEKASRNLTDQFGSVEAAKTVYESRNKKGYLTPVMHFAAANLSALEKVKELQELMEQGHEDYNFHPLNSPKTFESELNEMEQKIDRSNFGEMPEAMGAFEETKEQQMEKLTIRVDELLQKYEGVSSQKPIDYDEVRKIKEALEKNSENSVRVNKNGKVEVSYHPLNMFVVAEDTLNKLDKVLSGN